MDAVVEEVAERGVDEALAGDPRLARERRAFDGQREMAFAAAVVAGVADVAVALIVELEPGRGKRGEEPLPDLGGDRGGGDAVHLFYIER